MTRRERALLRLLDVACDHIESELAAAGYDEVQQHPILLDKFNFLTKARKQIRKWSQE